MQLAQAVVAVWQAALHPGVIQWQHHRAADHPRPGEHRAAARGAQQQLGRAAQARAGAVLELALRAAEHDGRRLVLPHGKARPGHGLQHLLAVPGLLLGYG